MRARQELIDLYERHVRLVWNVCYTFLRNVTDVEDAVQETFLRLYLSEQAFSDDNHARAWLITAAKNVCRDELRRSRRRDVPLSEVRNTAAPVPLPDETLQAVRALPEKYRDVIYLYYYEGYHTAEIACLLQKKEATVRSLLRRGRIQLRQSLGGSTHEE